MGDFAAKTKTKKTTKVRAKITPVLMALAIFLSGTFALRAVEFKLDANYNQEIWELNQQISDKRKEADSLRKQIDVYKKSLAGKQREIASLSYQVSTINQTITKISLEKEALELNVEEIKLQIKNAQLKIQATEEQISIHKERLAELIRTLYRTDQQYNLLAILATHDNLSDYFTQIQALQSIQDDVLGGLDVLGTLRIALVSEQEALDESRQSLESLQGELDLKKQALEDQKTVKYSLLDETRGQENTYQQLLEELRGEQDRINNDIVSLEQVAREQLNRQLKQGVRDLGSGPMIWPVPSREITAYFHDPDYPYRNVFEHPGIDIRSVQGSPIYAAASGYVARAKDAGMGYSYIMLIHDNGITTVYGHISGISVTEGSFVTQGQNIGSSGGKPGTPGAGRLTTGPHLHFEVRINGIPVNPLNYLP